MHYYQDTGDGEKLSYGGKLVSPYPLVFKSKSGIEILKYFKYLVEGNDVYWKLQFSYQHERYFKKSLDFIWGGGVGGRQKTSVINILSIL